MEKRGISVADFTKKTALLLMAVYFASVMIFSYKTEYFKISNILFILFAGMVILYRIEKISIIPSNFYIYVVIFLVYSITSFYWAIYQPLVISRSRTYLNLALLAVMVINIIENNKDLEFALKTFAISGAAMCIYTMVFYGMDNIREMMLMGERIGGEINQENAFGLICGLSFVISASYAAFEKKIIFFAISILLAFSILLTGSRTSILTIFLVIAMILFFNSNSKKTMRIIASIAVFAVIFHFLSQSEYFSFIFKRFELFSNFFSNESGMEMVDGSTETRFQMMSVGIKWFLENPIIGYGTQQYDYLYLQNFGQLRYAHNFHVQMLVDHGILGYLLVIQLIFAPVKLAFSNYKKNTVSKIILMFIAFLVISGMGNQFMSHKVIWITFGFIHSYIYVYKKRKKDED